MTLFIVLVAVATVVTGFFAWANNQTRKRHAKFQTRDVEIALEEVISPNSPHDTWDLFLNWPINEPYLESVRTRCLKILAESSPPKPGEDISQEAVQRIQLILNEMSNRTSARLE